MTDAITPGIYRHYKGNHYWVIGIAAIHDTDRILVVYTSSMAADNGHLLLRDYADFLAPVEWPDGVTRPRFVREGWE